MNRSVINRKDVEMTAMAQTLRHARTLVSPELFEHLVADLVKDGEQQEWARRCVDQGLAFLGACASRPADAPALAPAPEPDKGWHAFILRTTEYVPWCERVAGRYLHHVPEDGAGPSVGEPIEVRDRTLEAIQDAGFLVDSELWVVRADGECHQCYEHGCAGTGSSGNENTENQNPTKSR